MKNFTSFRFITIMQFKKSIIPIYEIKKKRGYIKNIKNVDNDYGTDEVQDNTYQS